MYKSLKFSDFALFITLYSFKLMIKSWYKYFLYEILSEGNVLKSINLLINFSIIIFLNNKYAWSFS